MTLPSGTPGSIFFKIVVLSLNFTSKSLSVKYDSDGL
jgi:hypothetical protein